MRVAILTGGASDVGRAVSRQLLDAGRFVVSLNPVGEPVGPLEQGPRLRNLPCDPRDPEACRAVVDGVEASIGKVDILVHAADLVRNTAFHEMSVGDWRDVVDANLHSLYNICRPIIPGMRERKFGRVIIVSSVIGQMGGVNQTSYAAAKAAGIGFARALALENAKCGVTVNAVAAGGISGNESSGPISSTGPEPPVGRFGSADEVARCVCFLAEDASGFITGETLNVNGGGYLN